MPNSEAQHEVRLYIEAAREMLKVASFLMAEGFFGSAVNRAYYAIFYAASAMLATRGLSRGKHSSVIAAFRQHFVKPGHMEAEYSEIYGRIMDDRHVSDYDVEAAIEPELARRDLEDAHRLVCRAERYLREGGWL